MKISTRGRYAIRVLTELALHAPQYADGSYVSLKEIAAHQDISLKYLEQIVPALSAAGYIKGVHGKGGGYKLALPPEQCVIGDVLRLTEGSLAPVACLECSAEECTRAAFCPTLPMWKEFETLISDYFDSKTLADLLPDHGIV